MKNDTWAPFARAAVTLMLLMLLAACGGGGGSSAPASGYTVGGTVSGLSGAGLVLKNHAGSALAVSAPGAFTFPDSIASGAAYSVTVAAQPSSPSQQCIVTDGSGTVGTANVTNVTVTCSTTFTILANQPPDIGYLCLL